MMSPYMIIVFAATLEQLVDAAVVGRVCRSAPHALDQLLALAEAQVPRLVQPGVEILGVESVANFFKAVRQKAECFVIHREGVGAGKLGKRAHLVEHQERALVAQHLEDGKDLDPQRPGKRFQLVDLLAGQGTAPLADRRIALEAKRVLEIEDQRVHLEVGQEADHVLEVLHRGDLAVAELVVDAAHRHLRPVAHAHRRQGFASPASDQHLAQGRGAVEQASIACGADHDARRADAEHVTLFGHGLGQLQAVRLHQLGDARIVFWIANGDQLGGFRRARVVCDLERQARFAGQGALGDCRPRTLRRPWPWGAAGSSLLRRRAATRSSKSLPAESG